MPKVLIDSELLSDLRLALKIENEESQLYPGDPGRWSNLLARAYDLPGYPTGHDRAPAEGQPR